MEWAPGRVPTLALLATMARSCCGERHTLLLLIDVGALPQHRCGRMISHRAPIAAVLRQTHLKNAPLSDARIQQPDTSHGPVEDHGSAQQRSGRDLVGIRQYKCSNALRAMAWSPHGRAVVIMDLDCTFGDIVDASADQPHALSTCQARLTGRDRGWGWPQWAQDESCIFQPSNGYLIRHPTFASDLQSAMDSASRLPSSSASLRKDAKAAAKRSGEPASSAAAYGRSARAGQRNEQVYESEAVSMPYFVTCGASLSPCGTYLVDLVGNDLLAPGLKRAPAGNGSGANERRLDPAPLARDQSSLYHYDVSTREVHVIVPNLRRRRGSYQALKVAWHPLKWPETRLLYACTDFQGKVMLVDARQHRLLGAWDKASLLRPILRPNLQTAVCCRQHPVSKDQMGTDASLTGGLRPPGMQTLSWQQQQQHLAAADQHDAAACSQACLDSSPCQQQQQVLNSTDAAHSRFPVSPQQTQSQPQAQLHHVASGGTQAALQQPLDRDPSAWHNGRSEPEAAVRDAVQTFESDGDWCELCWSPDGLQLSCVGRGCLAIISMAPEGPAGVRALIA